MAETGRNRGHVTPLSFLLLVQLKNVSNNHPFGTEKPGDRTIYVMNAVRGEDVIAGKMNLLLSTHL